MSYSASSFPILLILDCIPSNFFSGWISFLEEVSIGECWGVVGHRLFQPPSDFIAYTLYSPTKRMSKSLVVPTVFQICYQDFRWICVGEFSVAFLCFLLYRYWNCIVLGVVGELFPRLYLEIHAGTSNFSSYFASYYVVYSFLVLLSKFLCGFSWGDWGIFKSLKIP